MSKLSEIISQLTWQVTWFIDKKFFNTDIAFRVLNLNKTSESIRQKLYNDINDWKQSLRFFRETLKNFSLLSPELKEKIIDITYSIGNIISSRYRLDIEYCLNKINDNIHNLSKKSEDINNDVYIIKDFLRYGLKDLTPFDDPYLLEIREKGLKIADNLEKFLPKYTEDLKTCCFVEKNNEGEFLECSSYFEVYLEILRPLKDVYNYLFVQSFNILF